MSDTSIHLQRLQRVCETTKNSLNISTQVALAGGVAAPATMYQMDISFRSTRNKWSIAKRYSEFYAVRQQLRKFLKQYKQHLGSGIDCPPPLLALDKTLEAAFPRRHFRCDNNMIIAERRTALEVFVQSLVKIIASIPMTADVAGTSNAAATVEAKQLLALYSILRDFLEYPDKQIESETKLKLAVLSLEDVVVDSRSNLLEAVEGLSTSDCCSICLGEWDDEECVGMNVVKLPCLHAFHEECLLEWLQGNTHCPMCREEPRTTDSRASMDDSATCCHDHAIKANAAACTDRHTFG
ncbi:Ring finger domain [Phytophthora infestans]|uniref:Ring finger domain n=1 Tax=Phytophthora infestans TaxID=4787 RepID=A0A833S447_PHYIN|nr:Ring finger domain [Phytophthora infestans]